MAFSGGATVGGGLLLDGRESSRREYDAMIKREKGTQGLICKGWCVRKARVTVWALARTGESESGLLNVAA